MEKINLDTVQVYYSRKVLSQVKTDSLQFQCTSLTHTRVFGLPRVTFKCVSDVQFGCCTLLKNTLGHIKGHFLQHVTVTDFFFVY